MPARSFTRSVIHYTHPLGFHWRKRRMATPIKGNAVIGQSGGPTSVINQSLVGVIQEAKKAGFIDQLLGGRHGVSGMKAGNFIPLKDAPDDLLERIAQTPAAA